MERWDNGKMGYWEDKRKDGIMERMMFKYFKIIETDGNSIIRFKE